MQRDIRRLKKRHGHFADVIVADALYLNAPFINTLKECGLETVIRLKDERRLLFQDAESMFQRDEGRKRKGNRTLDVACDDAGTCGLPDLVGDDESEMGY